MKRLMVVGLALALGGCGASTMTKVNADYGNSLESYKECVRAHGPEGCRKEKAILEADAERYRAFHADAGTSSYRPAVYQPVGGGTVVRY